MVLQASGAISTADIATELELGSSGQFSTENVVLRGMANAVTDGVFSINDLYSQRARTLWNSKTTTMTIGRNTNSTATYGYGSLVDAGTQPGDVNGAMANTSVSFSNGVSGSITQLHITTSVLNQLSADVSPNDENDFAYLSQVKGPRLTFYHAGTGSTKVIQCTNGSAYNSIVAAGTGTDTAWFAARVGETVTLTIDNE